jgi:hypothetical protein
MLIDDSMNCNSAQCHVIQDVDENISVLGLPFMKYYTELITMRQLNGCILVVSWISVQLYCAVITRALTCGIWLHRK